MSELPEQILGTPGDEIGSLLTQARAIETVTIEKRGLIARAIEAMKASKYVSIRGTYSPGREA
jgi:hypothetical protein